jgi:hypothetical protein
MDTVLRWIGSASLLLAIGFGLGWHAKSTQQAAKEGRAAATDVSALQVQTTKAIDQRQQDLEHQADATATWIAQQRGIAAAGADIHLEIDHASFTPQPLGTPASCPDPIGSAEFELLYDRAAAGAGDTAAGASPGRVPPDGD